MIGSGIANLHRGGACFVGTPQALIQFHKGNLRSIDWEQLSGDLNVSGDSVSGSVTLGLKTGKMVSEKEYSKRSLSEKIQIVEIPEPFAVFRLCQQRIKENDLTAVSQQ